MASTASTGRFVWREALTTDVNATCTFYKALFGWTLKPVDMGGMIYTRMAMPAIPRYIGNLLPMTYFVRLSRGVFTKGVGMEFVWNDAVALVIYTVIVILVAARNFKKRLD